MATIRPLKDSSGIKAIVYTGANRNADWSMTLKDSAGAVVDITGWTIKAIIKDSISDADSLALLPEVSATLTDATNGVFSIPLSTSTITGVSNDAVLIIWRVVGTDKRILSQTYLDVVDSALD